MGAGASRERKQVVDPQPTVSGHDTGIALPGFHAIASEEAVSALHSDADRGLEPSEANARLIRLGPNRIPSPAPDPLPLRLLGKLKEPMSLLLIGAAAVAGIGLGERLDAVVILAIVAANAVIALSQEGKAARSLEALKTLESSEARVVRGGRSEMVPAEDLVAGDILLLAAGDRVPADVRMIHTASMEVDESLLTGESLPVAKDARAVSDVHAALADRPSMAFSATIVSRGTGRGVVAATGPATELGVIAESVRGRQPPTPLQVELAHLTGRLGVAAVVIALVVFILTLLSTGVTTEGLSDRCCQRWPSLSPPSLKASPASSRLRSRWAYAEWPARAPSSGCCPR